MLDKKLMDDVHINFPGIIKMETVTTIGCILSYIFAHLAYKPIQVIILIQIFTELGYLVLGILVFFIPPTLILIIGVIKGRKKVEKPNFAIVNASLGILAWFFIISFPLNATQLIIYVMTFGLIYIGNFEWFPILKINLRYRKLLKLEYNADRELVAKVIPETFSVHIAGIYFLFASTCRIYPVPFLLLMIGLKYLFKWVFFPDRLVKSDSEKFYKYWKRWENTVVVIYLTGYGLTLINWLLSYCFGISFI